MHSPPVQPIASSTSGTGSVRTMCDEVTETRARSGRKPRVAALSASTAAPARTLPPRALGGHAAGVRVQRADPRALVDRHAGGPHPRPQAERQPRGLDRRVVGHEQAAAEARRVAAGAHAGLVELAHAAARGDGEDVVDHGVVGGRRRGHHVAGAGEPGVDVLLGAPGADRLHALGRGATDVQRALATEALDQRRQMRPQRLAEAAVAPARAVAAQLGLEQHDRRAAQLQLPRRPQPRVAAADDDDVSADVAVQDGCGLDTTGFRQPVAVGGVDHYPS